MKWNHRLKRFPLVLKSAAIEPAGAPKFVLSLCLMTALSCGAGESWEMGPFVRHPGNPILSPRGDGWEAKDVFNPAAWSDGEEVWLLYRAEDHTGAGSWNGTSRIGLASSRDGLDFIREDQPILEPTEDWELPGGCEDPRLVKIGETFYLTYTAYDGQTARLALATSPDLRHWTKHGPLFPELGWTKAGAILSEPVAGRYWMYFGDTDVWAAHSADLLDWTPVSEPVLTRREDRFDSRVVEPGPPPLKTRGGILLLYNGANEDLLYAPGQALFDASDPTRLIARSEDPFLRPSVALEEKGQVPNVIFIQGLVQFSNKWILYYGMGDSHVGAAVFEPRS